MRVLLVGPDHEDNLSIRYLSSSLRAAGHEAEMAAFNCAADTDAVIKHARDFDMVGLSMCFQVRALEYLELAARLKQDGCALIVMGGHYASCEAEELMRHHVAIDIIAIHEGEHSLVEIADANGNASALPSIAGIVYRAGEHVQRSPQRRAITDLDSLPPPDRRGAIHLFAGVPTAYLLGSRGCVARCDYCCIVTLHREAPGKKFRRRDPAAVVAEMAELYHQRGTRQFIFHDDNFLVPSVRHNHQRLDEYERALAHHQLDGIGIVIKCRPPDAERSVFQRLKQMGLLRVFLGIESSSTAGLSSIGRVQTVAESEQALALCSELDISAQFTMMMFHPDATLDTVRSDMAFMRDNKSHAFNFCRTEIYAGTPLEKRMIAEGRARGNYLARTYEIADPTTRLICSSALPIFADRCWATGGVMERAIGMDHLDAIVGHYYSGAGVDVPRDLFRTFQRRANTQLVDLLSQVIDACVAAEGADDPKLRARLVDISAQEQAEGKRLLAEAAAVRAAIDELILPRIGVERSPDRTLSLSRQLSGVARHAAAVALAFTFASTSGCASNLEKGGVSEFAAPPLEDARAAPVADAGLQPSPPMDAAPVDAAPVDAAPIDATPKPDAKPSTPKTKHPAKPVREHGGVSEFAPFFLGDP